MPTELDGAPAKELHREGNISINAVDNRWIIRHHETPFLLELVLYLSKPVELFYRTPCCHARSQRRGVNDSFCSSCKESTPNPHSLADGCYMDEATEFIASWLSPHFGPLEEVIEASKLEDFINRFIAERSFSLDVYVEKLKSNTDAIEDVELRTEARELMDNLQKLNQEVALPLGEEFHNDMLSLSPKFDIRLVPASDDFVDPESVS